jgi:hypothetical protein
MKPLITKLISSVFAAVLILSAAAVVTSNDSKTGFASALAQTRRRTTATPARIVPLGTELRVRLEDDLSSKDSRVGDRFTAIVVGPQRYEGATVTGHVSSIKKSGRVKGRTTMALAFDSVRLPDGRRGIMHGEMIRLYGGGSSSKVDEEGNVESGSRGKQTLKRSGIGAAAGAVVGGLIGGGKGVAAGLIIGGAAGAGSVAIDGSKELKLESGTEMLVRVTRR